MDDVLIYHTNQNTSSSNSKKQTDNHLTTSPRPSKAITNEDEFRKYALRQNMELIGSKLFASDHRDDTARASGATNIDRAILVTKNDHHSSTDEHTPPVSPPPPPNSTDDTTTIASLDKENLLNFHDLNSKRDLGIDTFSLNYVNGNNILPNKQSNSTLTTTTTKTEDEKKHNYSSTWSHYFKPSSLSPRLINKNSKLNNNLSSKKNNHSEEDSSNNSLIPPIVKYVTAQQSMKKQESSSHSSLRQKFTPINFPPSKSLSIPLSPTYPTDSSSSSTLSSSSSSSIQSNSTTLSLYSNHIQRRDSNNTHKRKIVCNTAVSQGQINGNKTQTTTFWNMIGTPKKQKQPCSSNSPFLFIPEKQSLDKKPRRTSDIQQTQIIEPTKSSDDDQYSSILFDKGEEPRITLDSMNGNNESNSVCNESTHHIKIDNTITLQKTKQNNNRNIMIHLLLVLSSLILNGAMIFIYHYRRDIHDLINIRQDTFNLLSRSVPRDSQNYTHNLDESLPLLSTTTTTTANTNTASLHDNNDDINSQQQQPRKQQRKFSPIKNSYSPFQHQPLQSDSPPLIINEITLLHDSTLLSIKISGKDIFLRSQVSLKITLNNVVVKDTNLGEIISEEEKQLSYYVVLDLREYLLEEKQNIASVYMHSPFSKYSTFGSLVFYSFDSVYKDGYIMSNTQECHHCSNKESNNNTNITKHVEETKDKDDKNYSLSQFSPPSSSSNNNKNDILQVNYILNYDKELELNDDGTKSKLRNNFNTILNRRRDKTSTCHWRRKNNTY